MKSYQQNSEIIKCQKYEIINGLMKSNVPKNSDIFGGNYSYETIAQINDGITGND